MTSPHPLWRYEREPAGMGEYVYGVYRNDHRWFYLDDKDMAMVVVNALNRDYASHSSAGEAVPVYKYSIHLPSKNFPSITRRKLALNDIGEDSDDFTRLGFELKDGDIIQVLRQQQRERDRV